MKKYVLIGDGDGICGSTLYHEGRIIYLKNEGYDVYYINPSFNENKVVLNGILCNEHYLRCEEILNEPSTYKSADVKKIIKNIALYIGKKKNDSVFIETTSIMYGLWGELLAKEIKAIHFLYIIQSHFPNIIPDLREFVSFKYYQNLVGGMLTKTVPSIVGDITTVYRDTGIRASWSDPLFESDKCKSYLDSIASNKNENTRIVGYFGTLDKAYVAELIQSMIHFAEDNPKMNFKFVLVGSSSDGLIEKSIKKVKSCTNYSFFNIPSMYPVPRDVFRAMDCCIGSFGSATVAARAGVPTIRLYNDFTLVVNGIIGYTLVTPPPYNNIEPIKQSLIDVMGELLIDNKYKDVEFIAPPEQVDFFVLQRKEDEKIQPFIERDNCYLYFETSRIKYSVGKKYFIKRCLFRLLGTKVTNRILNLYRHFS